MHHGKSTSNKAITKFQTDYYRTPITCTFDTGTYDPISHY